ATRLASPLRFLGMSTAATLPAPGLCHSTNTESPPLRCVITGCWINDLGSKMATRAVNGKGNVTIIYYMAMMLTRNEIQQSPLQGSQHHVNLKSHPTFSLTISWSFSDATTAFAGQCFVDTGGKETLTTMWLLREAVGSLQEDWRATR
ncbi:AVID protein, partial [Glareola pratincola]|nr:AVID protein [Glareola pratincola]